MDGVILFADDKVLAENQPENRLYMKLCKNYPVLAVDSIDLADRAIKSIGTFSAIILDWEFKTKIGNHEEIKNPTALLDSSNFYSLIYVFSNQNISKSIKDKYKKKFDSRIVFKKKVTTGDVAARNFEKIKNDIDGWRVKNSGQVVALNWSNAINQAVQFIFSQLHAADVNWIIELHKSAVGEANPEIEVVNLLQSLLAERIITDEKLLGSIEELVNDGSVLRQPNKDKAMANLFQKIFYTDLSSFSLSEVPIMTGDIFKLDKSGMYGILITPECDIKKKLSSAASKFQFLSFKRKDFNNYVLKTYKSNNPSTVLGVNAKKKLSDNYNQDDQKMHLFASFPFTTTNFNETALIDFSTEVKLLSFDDLKKKERKYRLNSPYIQQLRQRYLAYVGRVGVPAIADGLKTYNISAL